MNESIESGIRRAQAEARATTRADSTAAVGIAIAVAEHGHWVLVGRRCDRDPLAGMWEFPGGKVQVGEEPEAAAVRECREETGLDVKVVSPFPIITHRYDHGLLRLHFFRCRLPSPQAAGSSLDWTVEATDVQPCDLPAPKPPFVWVLRDELPGYEFPEANRQVLDELTRSARSDACFPLD